MQTASRAGEGTADSTYAWIRLGVALVLGTIGSVGMWSFVVALPAVQADFGIARGEASLPFTLTMFGFGIGGIVMGRLADRFGIVMPVMAGAVALGAGYGLSGIAGGIGTLALAQGLLGFGSAATFGPLMTDISHWFVRRRGVAVTLTSAGNYVAGTVWSPLVQHLIASIGWRSTHAGIGIASAAAIVLRARASRSPVQAVDLSSMDNGSPSLGAALPDTMVFCSVNVPNELMPPPKP